MSSSHGRQLLDTRRVLERGVRFVQVWSGADNGFPRRNWDSHEDLKRDHHRDLDLRELFESAPDGGVHQFAGHRALILDAAARKAPLRIRGGGSKDFYGGELRGEVLYGLLAFAIFFVAAARLARWRLWWFAIVAGTGALSFSVAPNFESPTDVGGNNVYDVDVTVSDGTTQPWGGTALARSILQALGHKGEVPSPTFAIVQPYDPPQVRFPVLHVDLYRIENPDEAEELGLDDARYDSLLIVEWPERFADSYWHDALWLSLEPTPDGARALTAKVPAAWKDRWPQIAR